MSATISVEKKSISSLLSEGKKHKFLVPAYQRPYAWTDEQITTIFDDLWEYACDQTDLETADDYFLGSIVYFENENKEYEIIDGQQRITTIFLFLRAIFYCLENGEQNDGTINQMQEIAKLIWASDSITGKTDRSRALLTTKIMSGDNLNERFSYIMEHGSTIKDKSTKKSKKYNSSDRYSANYNLLLGLFQEKCKESPFKILEFIVLLLRNVILLPICAESQDTALTIFSTLNNRGLDLSDVDIFKAKYYGKYKLENKSDEFINLWSDLNKTAEEAGETMNRVFYYYQFYLMARDDGIKYNTSIISMRKYYLKNSCENLFKEGLFDDIQTFLTLSSAINKRIYDKNEIAFANNNIEIKKVLDILRYYPTEFWKYPVYIYFLEHHKDEDFYENFLAFLKKFCANIVASYIIFPTVQAIKNPVYALNYSISNFPEIKQPQFNFDKIDYEQLANRIDSYTGRLERMLLAFIAYANPEQKELLPINFHIEHILPKKWEEDYILDITKDEVEAYIEHLGNKVAFEEKLNITARNEYFGYKKHKYNESHIACVRDLCKHESSEWRIEDIKNRDAQVKEIIINQIKNWIGEEA